MTLYFIFHKFKKRIVAGFNEVKRTLETQISEKLIY